MNEKTKGILVWTVIIAVIVAALLILIPIGKNYMTQQNCLKQGGSYDGVYNVCLNSEQLETVITVDNVSPEIILGDAYDATTSAELVVTETVLDKVLRIADGQYVYPYYVGFGGTGNFLSLGLFNVDGDTITHTSSLLIGDRVILENISVPRVGTLIVDYLDRHSSESFATEPTITTQAIVELENNLLLPRLGYVNADDNDIYLETIENFDGVIEINGFARGTWFFEAVLPVEVYQTDYQLLDETFVTPDAGFDWMTDEFVPFTMAVNNQSGNVGHVVFKRNNVSDIIENDAAFTIFLR